MENVEKKKVTKEERLEQLKALLEKENERHAEKVAYYTDLIAKWEAKGDKLSGVDFREGDVVAFTYGRPGHVQIEREGTVIGFKDTGKAGVFAVIECGEGADKDIVRVRPSAVLSVVVASATVEEEVADEDETTEETTEAPMSNTIVL
jgi:hypothetical protein